MKKKMIGLHNTKHRFDQDAHFYLKHFDMVNIYRNTTKSNL